MLGAVLKIAYKATTMNCRFCKAPLTHIVVDLKDQPSANRLLSETDLRTLEDGQSEWKSSLTTYICDECSLVQLGDIVTPEDLFTEDYVYYSSYSKAWVEHARQFVGQVIPKFDLTEESRVLEIGSNDGYLLQHFVARNIPCRGIDPAGKAAEEADKKGVETFVGFFGEATSHQIMDEFGACDLIVGNNVFAHVPTIREFVSALKYCLSPKGVISLEFPHLARLVASSQFDTIYDEHYFYHSIVALRKIFAEFGLEIFEVQNLTTHGGSLRVFVTHTASDFYEIDASVERVLDAELAMKLDHKEGFETLQKQTELIRSNARDYIKTKKAAGKKIAAFGAAAKGNIFLNYCGISSSDIDFVADDTPAKQGKYLPGSHIPVVAADEIERMKPDIIIILPWNFRDEICQKLDFVKEWGGQLVTFVPDTKVS